MAGDYLNIGVVLRYLSRFTESLESHKRGLAINNELKDRVRIARDYMGIALVLNSMGEYKEALDSHNKALDIHKELNNRVGMAGDHYNISFILSRTNKKEALKSLSNALTILQEFEKQNNYHHPLIEQVNNTISYLTEEE